MLRFEKMIHRHVLTGRVELLGGLHIGAGKTQSVHESDSPVVKDFFGRPFIPGSSFKGALRNHLESLIRGLSRKDIWACDPLEEPCPRPPDDFEPSLKDRRRERDRRWMRVVRDWEIPRQLAESCTACHIFGSSHFASKVTVRDLSVVSPGWNNRFVQYREGTAIDRESDTAADARKIEFEVVPPGTVFGLEILIENAADGKTAGQVDELGLILTGLDGFSAGWAMLGGKRSFGLGRVTVHIDGIQTVTPQALLQATAATPTTGDQLQTLVAEHRTRLAQSLAEGTNV